MNRKTSADLTTEENARVDAIVARERAIVAELDRSGGDMTDEQFFGLVNEQRELEDERLRLFGFNV